MSEEDLCPKHNSARPVFSSCAAPAAEAISKVQQMHGTESVAAPEEDSAKTLHIKQDLKGLKLVDTFYFVFVQQC